MRRRRCLRSPSSFLPSSSPRACFFGGDRWNLGNELPRSGILWVFGFITGLFSSLVGVSGGAVSNAVLTLYGQPMQRAVATSAGVGVPITIAGTIGYILAGLRHMSGAAAAVDRLRVADRPRADGAGVELHRELWRAACALDAAAQAGDRLRYLAAAGRVKVFDQPILGLGLNYARRCGVIDPPPARYDRRQCPSVTSAFGARPTWSGILLGIFRSIMTDGVDKVGH